MRATPWLPMLGGGFLLAVLWMDLLFDVQVLRHRGQAELPEPVLASIAGYYRRVTREARPMSHLVGTVMLATLLAVVAQIVLGEGPRLVGVVSLALCGAPVLLAMHRVLPNALRLAARDDPPSLQSALARSICRDHLLCLAAISAFVLAQVAGAPR